ncbi:MAG: PepSY-like domain-containing protein [Cyclobacteriaceae bacterium]
MKTKFIVIALIVATSACAQKVKEKDIPSTVKSSLQKSFPKAEKVKWSKEESNYEAEFDLNKEETSVVIDASGNILETEVEIEVNKLPKEIVEYVKSKYNGQSIKEAARITDNKGVITYEAEVKGKDLIFSSDGKLVKESKD